MKVAPSLLAADPLNFAKEVRDVEAAGADYHHVDVMDGHFVPNLSYGPPLIRALKGMATIPLDVHIMVSNPDIVALDYVAAGADMLVFHVEAAQHSHGLLQSIRDQGAKAGVAINPGTSLENLWPLLPHVDCINVMSVNPGFGGQKFITEAISRIGTIHNKLKEIDRSDQVYLEVDGGINATTGAQVAEQGANLLVAGSYVFGSEDRAAAVASLHALA